MENFLKWLESVAVMSDKKTSTGNGIGNGDDFNQDDGGDDEDDDYENGPWGWNKMQSINLKLHDWAKTSPVMNQIKQLYTSYLFSSHPKENVRVFPGHVQLELEWEFNVHEWSDLDDKVEALLKRSDLWKPLNVTQAQLWTVVDRGAVYDYVQYVILMSLTGRQMTGGQRSYLDNQVSFHSFEYLKQDWNSKEDLIKSHIEDFHQENQLNPGQITLSAPIPKPTGVSQVYGSNLWAKGIIMIPYSVNVTQDNPDVWNSWGDERQLRYQ